MIKRIILASTLLSVVVLQSCKDGGTDLPPAVTAPTVVFPFSIPAVDGVFAAIVTETKNVGTTLKVGSAHAVFYKSKNSANKLDAGTVKINTKSTTRADDNTYFYTSSASEPNGLVYQSQVFWQVSGNTTNDIQAVSNNDGSGLPNIPNVPEFVNLRTDQDYLLNWVSSFGSDSVVVVLKGPSATYKKVFNNATTSTTIPMAEIAKLGIGSGSLTVTNYKMDVRLQGTKNYAFVKEALGTTNKVTIK